MKKAHLLIATLFHEPGIRDRNVHSDPQPKRQMITITDTFLPRRYKETVPQFEGKKSRTLRRINV
ncbi:MAG: hypothetical protein WCF26_14565 [Candidatus Sulfotelmatobacter sp.]